MNIKDKKIILASASPRRKELLAGLCIDFEVDTRNNFEEVIDPSIPHEEIPEVLSVGKSNGFHRPLENNEILSTSDTLVLCEGKVMGKPSSREDAYEMLKMLSGQDHKVITAVSIRDHKRIVTFSDTAIVSFKPLTDSEIYFYIDNFKPFDKAGAYGIQDGFELVKAFDGSFNNVVGLPVEVFEKKLREILEKN